MLLHAFCSSHMAFHSCPLSMGSFASQGRGSVVVSYRSYITRCSYRAYQQSFAITDSSICIRLLIAKDNRVY